MQLIIPDKLMVGFQNRQGTYSGKLAFVTYIDHKGKHRSELSWNNWQDKKTPHEELTNEPTTGFVLNKKVGGYATGWNHRKTYARVYDPRGFEFEIEIPNLLFILEHCSCIKGKGLEGEFVYAWGGKDLILLPVNCPDYKESQNYTNLQVKKITRKDMVQGCLYQTKNNDTVIYLGRHQIGEYDYCDNLKRLKRHVFKYMPDQRSNKYWFQNGYTKLASKLSDQPHAEFANLYDELMQSKYIAFECDIKVIPHDTSNDIWDRWMNLGEYRKDLFYQDDAQGLHYIVWERKGHWSTITRSLQWRYVGKLEFNGAQHQLQVNHPQPEFITELSNKSLNEQIEVLKKRLVSIELVNKHGETCRRFKLHNKGASLL